MIIGPYRRIHDVASFAKGLAKANRGMVSIWGDQSNSGESKICTGWLITDTLVLVPAYAFQLRRGRMPFSARFGDMEKPVPLELTDYSLSPINWEVRATLVRLAQPFPDRVLPLASQSLQIGEELLILHHTGSTLNLQVSFGRLLKEDPNLLTYDASTEAGSGGGAIFSAGDWNVAGIHMSSNSDARTNQGLKLATILENLRLLPEWEEIARQHRLANVAVTVATSSPSPAEPTAGTEASAPCPDELLSMAVRWSFDPEKLADRNIARPLVVRPNATPWMLTPAERQRLVEDAGSLSALREARRIIPPADVITGPGQTVIDRILAGPPYDLNQVDESLLPLWLQAVRWFSSAIPELPSPSEVNRNLEQRRIRSRLQDMTGKSPDGKSGRDFCGRETELKQLKEWYEDAKSGPMVVSGLGGVGKSALVAKFALSLTEKTILLWLDFDRPDLAPDDVVSVLAALAKQMLLQIPDFTSPEITATQWKECSEILGKALANAPAGSLMVLDGFEVAQRFQQHREIWKVLETMLAECATLRVMVSGRARVKDLELNQRKAASLHLGGLAKPHVEGWLKRHGIGDPKVIDEISTISRGLPLILRMAVYLVDSGGTNDVLNLPADLNESLREGYLYQRILDRVIDPELKPVAKDALVLRRLSEEIMSEVMADRLPSELPVPDAFARLQQDLSLIDDQGGLSSMGGAGEAGVIYLRPEIRAATLRLLEMDEPERVRELDRRAAAWYAKQDTTDVACAAELVYHRLRLDDLPAAKQAWVNGCELRLGSAEEDLPEDAEEARAWLVEKLENPDEAILLQGWEQDSVKRIQSALGRGLNEAVKGILDETADRSDNSPLVFYDTWFEYKSGNLLGAFRTLMARGQGYGEIRRNRTVLMALLSRDLGDRVQADELLATAEKPEEWPAWNGREDPLRLAVTAARVRLTVDLEKELQLARQFKWMSMGRSGTLAGIDVMLPWLRLFASPSSGLESIRADEIVIPQTDRELPEFAQEIERRKGGSWPTDLPPDLLPLAEQTQKRWRLASNSLFLHETIDYALNGSRLRNEELAFALAASLVPFRGLPLVSPDRKDFVFEDPLEQFIFDWRTWRVSADNLPKPSAELFLKISELEGWNLEREFMLGDLSMIFRHNPESQFLAFYLLSPDPLTCLCQILAAQRPPIPSP